MTSLLVTVTNDFPGLVFASGEEFCWSPKTNTVVYSTLKSGPEANWALLHEVGHAVLEHHSYQSDLELISLESQAWEKAKELATRYGQIIDVDHIEDCMDTYRDWLHQRSACPVCTTRSLQQDAQHYHCHNCGQIWKVTSSRFCRPYRRKEAENKKSPQSITSEATFV
jgi:predicted RNA-binding Zn-ribbon protein involved in translation (DUF1610 family)